MGDAESDHGCFEMWVRQSDMHEEGRDLGVTNARVPVKDRNVLMLGEHRVMHLLCCQTLLLHKTKQNKTKRMLMECLLWAWNSQNYLLALCICLRGNVCLLIHGLAGERTLVCRCISISPI